MTASLWLVPHKDGIFNKAVQELINDDMPAVFYASNIEKHKFLPHVTLTSQINPSKTYEAPGQTPQEWLDGLSLPAEFKREFNEVKIELDHLEAGDTYHRKLTIAINQDDNLSKLAAQCRRECLVDTSQDVDKWAKTDYEPHLSLMYADIPTRDVENKLALVEMKLGFSIGDLFACCGGTLCMGGSLVLVDTSKPIEDWNPIAQRETPWAMWTKSRTFV